MEAARSRAAERTGERNLGKTILVVDDSSTIRLAVVGALRSAGHEVVEAADGEEALGLLDGRKIHLIVSDVNMPRMDGLAFARAAKSITAYRFIPIVMLTTVVDEAKKIQGRSIGVHAWVVKPFQEQVLLDAVSMLLPT
jgi:two-component system chemotaxis response regulator CheY